MNMVFDKGRAAAIVAALLLAFAALLALTGCSSDQEKIKAAVDSELGALVDPDDAAIDKLVDEADSVDEFAMAGIEVRDFVKSWIDGFSYEVGDISVDGDKAEAKVTITCKNLGQIIQSWTEASQAEMASMSFTTTDEIYEYVGSSLMAAVDSAEPTPTEVTIELEKDGTDWVAPDSAANQEAINTALIGGSSSY